MTTYVTAGDETHLPDLSIEENISRITLYRPGLVTTISVGDQP